MPANRTGKTHRSPAEILLLRQHRRITLRCPRCDEYGLMSIRRKTRIRGTVNYHVTCPNCGWEFVQIGRPYNFWRDMKRRYNLNAEQLRSMQGSLITTFMNTSQILASENERTVCAGDFVFIKPNPESNPSR